MLISEFSTFLFPKGLGYWPKKAQEIQWLISSSWLLSIFSRFFDNANIRFALLNSITCLVLLWTLPSWCCLAFVPVSAWRSGKADNFRISKVGFRVVEPELGVQFRASSPYRQILHIILRLFDFRLPTKALAEHVNGETDKNEHNNYGNEDNWAHGCVFKARIFNQTSDSFSDFLVLFSFNLLVSLSDFLVIF